MCICKTSKVIGTSGNLAAILDFSCTSTSHEIGSTTIRKLDPKNIVTVGMMSLCTSQKNRCREFRVKAIYPGEECSMWMTS